ncbi:MAG: FkbM family methyltransferase [Candidatus Pacebacteria bacterium]|jgi:FkbM family methyltransferase|nr:FkbM family methyltransferase [Candidatus Paceibacterota bacterium]
MKKEKQEKLLLERIEFHKRKFEIRLRPDADESVVAEIFEWRDYKVIEEIIEKGNLPILDVGAHIGIFSLYVSALNPTLKIYALEPERVNFALLLKNISVNKLGNVKTHKVALAGRAGERELALASDSINHHLISDSEKNIAEDAQTEKVVAVSLADFLETNHISAVDLMKMDIEAGEYEVFENLTEEDFAKIHNIFLEYHDYDGRNHREIETILREHGFSVQIFPSQFERDLGFILARNKRAGK